MVLLSRVEISVKTDISTLADEQTTVCVCVCACARARVCVYVCGNVRIQLPNN